jgi:hypothetical protein
MEGLFISSFMHLLGPGMAMLARAQEAGKDWGLLRHVDSFAETPAIVLSRAASDNVVLWSQISDSTGGLVGRV